MIFIINGDLRVLFVLFLCSFLTWRTTCATTSRIRKSPTVKSSDVPPRACSPPHDNYPFCNVSLPLDRRLDDLIGRLTLEEKPFLLTARESPKGNISRLGIPEYDWGGNCIHGVQSRCAPDGKCPTSFPNPNALGATFNRTLWKAMRGVIGLELRALWLQMVGENNGSDSNLPHIGLDCWSPNIGIVRDPRWGRNLETPSEDPLICGMFGSMYTLGLQNNSKVEPRYLQAVSTLKHFDANSLEGPYWTPNGTWSPTEGTISRHSLNAKISLYDLASSYLPAFQRSVEEGGAAGIMCSYNRINGVPVCGNEYLLKRVLRHDWKFRGYVTSDSGALNDFGKYHHYTESYKETVALAIRAGCDIESAGWKKGEPWATGGNYITYLASAVRDGLVSEEVVDRAVRNALEIRFRLGLFDPIENQPFWKISADTVQSKAHVQLAKEATGQGFVLLKNEEKTIPLNPESKIALVGPYVDDRGVMIGNYIGQICSDRTFNCVESFHEGFANLTSNLQVSRGCEVVGTAYTEYDDDANGCKDKTLEIASQSDVVVFLGGLNLTLERESLDRSELGLPEEQVELIHQLAQVNSKIVLVLMHGGIVALDNVVDSVVSIVSLGYPGRYAGRALAEALLGVKTHHVWGKLAVTWYKSSIVNELNMVDFDMSRPPGRTYRYFTGEPLYPFGHGLNTAVMSLTDIKTSQLDHDIVSVTATLSNTGDRDGDDVVMAFFAPVNGTIPASEPASKLQKQLFGFQRVPVEANKSISLDFRVSRKTLQLYDDIGMPIVYLGVYTIELTNGSDRLQTIVTVGDGRAIEVMHGSQGDAGPSTTASI